MTLCLKAIADNLLCFQAAASIAFLIARYFARERILKLVEGNKKFLAIDKAIGENGFKVVTLLRLSPLLPFSLGNYLYGLTSVKFIPYVLGRFVCCPSSRILAFKVDFLHYESLLSGGHLIVSTSLKVDCHLFVFCYLLSFKMNSDPSVVHVCFA
jgi:uncharacterized membrane protein YdjX (TVP38/TMEM64 family)